MRNLQLYHVGCADYLVENRAVRLTRLEVERAVLRLQDNILTEQSVQRLELRDGLFYTIFALVVGTIDKAAPHDNAAMRLQGVSQHVGTLGMGTVVVARSRLALAVGFDEETTEVRNQLINLVGLLLPPSSHLRRQWVCGLGVPECHW